MAATEKHWTDKDFQDLKLNTPELYFTKKKYQVPLKIRFCDRIFKYLGFSNKGHGKVS